MKPPEDGRPNGISHISAQEPCHALSGMALEFSSAEEARGIRRRKNVSRKHANSQADDKKVQKKVAESDTTYCKKPLYLQRQKQNECSIRLTVRTADSHSANKSSILLSSTKKTKAVCRRRLFLYSREAGRAPETSQPRERVNNVREQTSKSTLCP